jgi:phosphate:Na+ symporter
MTEQANTIEFGVMLVGLAGGLALFLYGMRKLTEALKLVAGEHAKNILARLTTNRFSAAMAGAGVTAVIQSSSITTVLVVGFVTAGVMTFTQSIGIILGANVGTTITAQIIAFKITKTALVLIAVGFFTEVLTSNSRVRQVAIMSMGLGMLFFGMELMSQATEPLRTYAPFMELMQNLDNPVMGILMGAVFTALVQSSSATTGIVIIMASQGFITLETGIALIMGANVGTCVTAYISAIGRPREAMQVAMAHILFNVIGVLLFVLFIPVLADFVREISPQSENLREAARLAADTPRQIANAHTIFNVLNLVIFLGFTRTLSSLVLRIIPDDPLVMVEIIEPKYIDPYYLDQPTLALDRVRMEIARMGSHALSMVRDSMPVLTVGTGERIDSLKKRDDEIDILHKAIIIYLHKLSSGDLLNPLPARLYRYVTSANSIENVADIVEKGVVPDSRKRLDRQLVFSEGTEEMIKAIYKETYQAGQLSMEALDKEDIEKAQRVIDSKNHFNGLVERARAHLYSRLTQESPEHLAVYKVESNTIENYRRMHHQFVNICEHMVQDLDKDKQQNDQETETAESTTDESQ